MLTFWSLFLLFRHDVLAIGKHLVELAIGGGLELAVVHLYAVVEVQRNAGKCQMADLFVVVPALLQLLGQLVLALGGGSGFPGVGGVVHHVLHPVDLGFIHTLHLVQVVHTQGADSIRGVAVEVDQHLKAVLLAAVEQPVDGALAGASD